DPLVSSGYIELGLVSASDNGAMIRNGVVREDLKDATSVIVIVDQVELEVKGKGWVPVLTSPVTIDLLKLDNKTITSLGITKLPTGHVDDLRLRLHQIRAYIH